MQPAVGDLEVFNPAVEADLTAMGLDPLADGLDHGGQAVAAQVRTVLVQDRRLALALGEQFQDSPHVRSRAAIG